MLGMCLFCPGPALVPTPGENTLQFFRTLFGKSKGAIQKYDAVSFI